MLDTPCGSGYLSVVASYLVEPASYVAGEEPLEQVAYVVDDFLTAEQCDSVITLAEPRLERSQTSTTANISSTKTRSRTSSGTALASPNGLPALSPHLDADGHCHRCVARRLEARRGGPTHAEDRAEAQGALRP